MEFRVFEKERGPNDRLSRGSIDGPPPNGARRNPYASKQAQDK
ncbi:hypothetical protein GCM10027423_44400 [Spirosoma arcticum]